MSQKQTAPQGFGHRRGNMGAPIEKPKSGGKTLRRLLAYFASHRTAVILLFSRLLAENKTLREDNGLFI